MQVFLTSTRCCPKWPGPTDRMTLGPRLPCLVTLAHRALALRQPAPSVRPAAGHRRVLSTHRLWKQPGTICG